MGGIVQKSRAALYRFTRAASSNRHDKPYRKSKPGNFRKIHLELAAAVRDGRKCALQSLETTVRAIINAREKLYIAARGNAQPHGPRDGQGQAVL